MVGLISLHLLILWLQKHTQFPGGRATEDNVVGRHLWPGQAFRSLGLLFLTAAVLAGFAGLVQINPVWVYGPFVPYSVSSPAQPDWYLGWLEGSLRLGPNIEPTILGVTIPSPFVPGILLPAIIFGAFTLWPFLEARFSHDHDEHHLLQYPWQAPVRSAIGAAALTLLLVLTISGGNDVLAVFFQVGLEQLTWALRFLAVIAPIVVGLVVYRLAIEQRRHALAEVAT
jgi:ubiquinol-cytochrome c reductase cytochrome b subunit